MQINIKATNAKLTPEAHEIIEDKIFEYFCFKKIFIKKYEEITQIIGGTT